MLTSAIFHLQGYSLFLLPCKSRPAPWEVCSSSVCSHLLRIWPAKAAQAFGPGWRVLTAWVSSQGWCRSASSRFFGFNVLLPAAVHHLYSCRSAEFGRLTVVWEWEEQCQQAVRQSVMLETLTKSRRVS